MNNENWTSKNYDHADAYIVEHEEEIQTHAVIDCGKGVHAILPKGLPALKIRFHGLFMIAPLPILIACVIFLPLSGFLGEWEVNAPKHDRCSGQANLRNGSHQRRGYLDA